MEHVWVSFMLKPAMLFHSPAGTSFTSDLPYVHCYLSRNVLLYEAAVICISAAVICISAAVICISAAVRWILIEVWAIGLGSKVLEADRGII